VIQDEAQLRFATHYFLLRPASRRHVKLERHVANEFPFWSFELLDIDFHQHFSPAFV